MSHTAHSNPEQVKERYDNPKTLENKVNRLVELIRESQHFICFTGAGISTSAGIPDFRGPEGKWTLEAQGKKPKKGVRTISAVPTDTHMSLVKLAEDGVLKYLISQNCDGLHIRSGFPSKQISELHGNGNIEICENCGQKYFRDLSCYRMKKGADHWTGRHCDRAGCRGRLLNSTIDFGQSLPQDPMERGFENAEKADLCMVLGSSLTVSPACNMPETTMKNGKDLIIVNLQTTPYTRDCLMHIFAKTDTVMRMVMEKLNKPIPEFRLRRKVVLGVARTIEQSNWPVWDLYCRGADFEDPSLEMHFLTDVDWHQPTLSCDPSVDSGPHEIREYELPVPKNEFTKNLKFESRDELTMVKSNVTFYFKGHYREPALTVDVDFTPGFKTGRVEYVYSLEYSLNTQRWYIEQELSTLTQNPSPNVDPGYGKSHRDYVVSLYCKNSRYNKKSARKLFDAYVRRNQKKDDLKAITAKMT